MTVADVIAMLSGLDPGMPVMNSETEPLAHVYESEYHDEAGTHRFAAMEFDPDA